MQALLIKTAVILLGLRSMLLGEIKDIHIEHVQKGVRGTMRNAELKPMEKIFRPLLITFNAAGEKELEIFKN